MSSVYDSKSWCSTVPKTNLHRLHPDEAKRLVGEASLQVATLAREGRTLGEAHAEFLTELERRGVYLCAHVVPECSAECDLDCKEIAHG